MVIDKNSFFEHRTNLLAQNILTWSTVEDVRTALLDIHKSRTAATASVTRMLIAGRATDELSNRLSERMKVA